MRKCLAILAVVLAAMLIHVRPANADATVQVVETDPAGESVTLGRNQNFYLHLHYDSDRPIRIWVVPLFEGKPANAGANTSRLYPAGSGDALGWFFFMQPGGRVDEIRINAGDGSIDGTRTVARYPVRITGGDEPAAADNAPGWVNLLRARDDAAQQTEQRRMENTPLSTGDTVLFVGFMVGVPALGLFGLLGPAWGLWRWRGGWRIAAVAPGAMMAFVVLRLIVDTSRDPTSHNLWPFEILMVGGLSTVVIVALMVARRIAGAGRT